MGTLPPWPKGYFVSFNVCLQKHKVKPHEEGKSFSLLWLRETFEIGSKGKSPLKSRSVTGRALGRGQAPGLLWAGDGNPDTPRAAWNSVSPTGETGSGLWLGNGASVGPSGDARTEEQPGCILHTLLKGNFSPKQCYQVLHK